MEAFLSCHPRDLCSSCVSRALSREYANKQLVCWLETKFIRQTVPGKQYSKIAAVLVGDNSKTHTINLCIEGEFKRRISTQSGAGVATRVVMCRYFLGWCMLLSKLAGQMIGCLEIHESMDLNQWVKVKLKESCLPRVPRKTENEGVGVQCNQCQ